MKPPLLLDLSHTSHTRARTGIQRVTRSLHAALGGDGVAITHDPYLAGWRTLQRWEEANVRAAAPASKRGAQWPWVARVRGRAQRLVAKPEPLPANAGVVVPEVFSVPVARALPELFASAGGPRVAVFHDAIALQYPELTPVKTVARFPAYLRELLAFDGVAAVSADSRTALLDYWKWLGVSHPPPVEPITLGMDPRPATASGENSPAGVPTVLCVGSIEGRKNHLALLEACEALWARGESFSLHLVGLAQPQTAAAALERMNALRAAGRPLRYAGAVSDAAVSAAYAACSFTVYPSLMEGFGLPVIESVAHGKPCICASRGALGESAKGGGCLSVRRADAESLAAAIASLLHSPEMLARLAQEARARRLKSWADYAYELTTWIRTLQRR